MEKLHQLMLEDEILFCGIVLIFGMVTGAVARWLAALRERRTT